MEKSRTGKKVQAVSPAAQFKMSRLSACYRKTLSSIPCVKRNAPRWETYGRYPEDRQNVIPK